MAFELQSEFLEFKPDTVNVLRKSYGLHQEGRMEQALDLLEDWIKKQNHFLRQDFPRELLEIVLISSKGMVERAKKQIDKLCTLKTLVPHLFTRCDITEFEDMFDTVELIFLPQMTDNYHRVIIAKATGKHMEARHVKDYFEVFPMILEYLKRYDYSDGNIVVFDYRKMDMLNFISKLTLSEVREIMIIIMSGYGMRLKGLYMISESKAIDIFASIVKQAVSSKIGNRISVFKTPEELFHIIPKDMWPSDYGGKEISSDKLCAKLRNGLGRKSVMEYVRQSFTYGTDESKRQSGEFNEEYMGLPGSFRTMVVD